MNLVNEEVEISRIDCDILSYSKPPKILKKSVKVKISLTPNYNINKREAKIIEDHICGFLLRHRPYSKKQRVK